MQQFTFSAFILLGLSTAIVFSQEAPSPTEPDPQATSTIDIDVEGKNPWTRLEISNSSKNFQFVVAADVSRSVDKLNLLQPEFVVSVGNQIEGETETAEQWTKQWAEFDSAIAPLQMPCFFCAGDRDIPNESMSEQWHRKFGRSYYSFRYRDVLFLVLNTEDLPAEGVPYQIGTAQQRWAIEQLNNNRDARWTFVIMHKPTWTFIKKEHHPGKLGWESIEDALQGRSYTVLAGHLGEFARYERKGGEYYHLGSTDVASDTQDEIKTGQPSRMVRVTMSETGPVFAYLKSDGQFSKQFQTLPDPKREK